jgi:hypothetical protein
LQSLLSSISVFENKIKEKDTFNSKLMNYLSKPSDYLVVKVVDELSKIISSNPSYSSVVFVKNVNIWTEQSVRLVNERKLTIISPEIPSKKLRQSLDYSILNWKSFIDLFLDKAVILRKDLTSSTSQIDSVKDIIEEYKAQRQRP